MGQPTYGNAYVSYTESIGIEKVTRGTETSKYPEEEKEIRFRKQRRANAEQAKPLKFTLVGLRTYHNEEAIVDEESWKAPL